MEQSKEWLTQYLKEQIKNLDSKLKENRVLISEAESNLKVHQTEQTRLLTIIHDLEEHAKDSDIDLSETKPTVSETHGEEFYSDIGRKGGQCVRKLIEEGKEHESE